MAVQTLKFFSLPLLVSLAACGGGGKNLPDIPSGGDSNDDPSLDLVFSDPGARSSGVDGVKFVEDIKYGDHDRQRFDIHMPESAEPTRLLLFFHGGGFTGGSEDTVYSKLGDAFPSLLEAGYAVATATYRLIDGTHLDGVKRSLYDTKYALQFIRHHAGALNIDPDHVVLAGNSAGASSSLWIALQDDMLDATADDPVLQQSTRVKGIAIQETQATLDTMRWNSEVFAEYSIGEEEGIQLGGGAERALSFYGVMPDAAAVADPIAALDTAETEAYRQSVDMLDFMTSDDPELWVSNVKQAVSRPTKTGSYFHHAYHAKTIQHHADRASVPGVFYYGPNASEYSDPSMETLEAFIFRKLAE